MLLLLAKGERTDFVTHAPIADHLAGQFGGPLDVVAGAGSQVVEEDLLGRTPAHCECELVFEKFPGVSVLVVYGQGLR